MMPVWCKGRILAECKVEIIVLIDREHDQHVDLKMCETQQYSSKRGSIIPNAAVLFQTGQYYSKSKTDSDRRPDSMISCNI